MTRLSILALSSVLVCGLSACSASSQQTTTQSAEKVIAPMATVKPGANVTLNSVLPKAMASGSFQTVQLRFTDGYSAGPLSVEIKPSEGLRLFGGASTKIFDMANSGEHLWDIDVKADVDGVYFLNVFASAEGQQRSFSVRVDMGQTTQKMFNDAMPAEGDLIDGGEIRALDADETIE